MKRTWWKSKDLRSNHRAHSFIDNCFETRENSKWNTTAPSEQNDKECTFQQKEIVKGRRWCGRNIPHFSLQLGVECEESRIQNIVRGEDVDEVELARVANRSRMRIYSKRNRFETKTEMVELVLGPDLGWSSKCSRLGPQPWGRRWTRQIQNIVVGQNFDKETVDWNNKQELDTTQKLPPKGSPRRRLMLLLNGTGGVHGSEDLDWFIWKNRGLRKS